MLKFIITFTLSLLIYHNSTAQTFNQKDSLQVIIKKNQKDTNTVWALLGYGRIMSNEKEDSANLYFQKGYELSKNIKFNKGISGYYANVTYLFGHRKKQFAKALTLAKNYEKFAKTQKNDYFLAKSFFAYAAIFQSWGKADSAIIYYEKAILNFEKVKDLSEMAVIYTNLSGIYLNQNLFDLGIQYGKKALDIDNVMKDTLGMISDNTNLSILYFEKKNSKLEEFHLRESLMLSKKVNSPYDIMMTCLNMAEMFKTRSMYDSSIFYGEKTYKYALKYGSDNIKFENSSNLADTYIELGQYKKALPYFESAIKLAPFIDLNLKRKIDFTDLKIKFFNKTGQFKEAAILMLDYQKLTDSLAKNSALEEVLTFENKLKKAESEKIILAKEIEISKQRTWLYVLSISGFALLLLGFLLYRYQNKKQIAKSQQIKLLEQENEFVAVKASLEGQLNERVRISKEIHDDLGSSMTTISLLTEILKTKVDLPEVSKISDTSAKMVDAMNEIVWSLNTQNDRLGSLVAFIRKYARDFLQDTHIKLVFDENVNQDFTLPGHVRRSIYLVIKEAINNVVKHADAHELKLNITTDNQVLVIKIQDDGKGMNVESKTVLGHGLKNMRQRMADIGGSLQISQSKGMLVELSFKFI